MLRRDGGIPVLLSLALMVIITTIALQVLWGILVVENMIIDMLTNIGVSDTRKVCRHDGGYHGWADQGMGRLILWVHYMYLVIVRC